MRVSKLSQEVLSNYQVRKTKKQKQEFREFLQRELGNDHKVVVEQSGMFKSKNVIVGNLEDCEYILGAHYDTAPELPFPNFITPKNILIYLLYNVLIFAGLGIIYAFIMLGISLFVEEIAGLSIIVAYLLLILFCWMMMFGKANKHTANDNTSGVIMLLEVLQDKELSNKVCCVFFDHEEVGLIGSGAFAYKHSKELKDKVMINFDCIADGDHAMLILSKPQLKNEAKVKAAFTPIEGKEVIVTKSSNTMYPSDQANFKNHIGVAVLKKHKLIGYYLDKVHTRHDNNFDDKNIFMLLDGLKRFICE